MEKYALITGASTGIGYQLSKLFANDKCNLILVARSEDKLEKNKIELENTCNIKVHTIATDLSEESNLYILYEEVSKIAKIDYLVNNAGFGGTGSFYQRDVKTDIKMIKLNIIAPTVLSKLFAKTLIEKNGSILNISSSAALMPGPRQAVYFASKAYVRSFSNAINEELRREGVSVTNIMPGAVDTNFGDVANMRDTKLFKKASTPEKIAKMAYKAFKNKKIEALVGNLAQLRMFNLATKILPKRFTLKTTYNMQINQNDNK